MIETRRKNHRLLFVVGSFIISSIAYAQPVEQLIKVIVAPDHADWVYASGEKVKFTITVLQNGNTFSR